MISEQIQFAISQYLDGTLPEGERAALEARLAADAELRRVLEEYRALHEALRGSMVLPAVKWEKLAERISASVEQLAANPIDEQTEYAIAQYVDGQLPEGERAALEKRLESDPAARMAMEEYRSLQRVTERAWSLPRVDWQRLSERISDAVAEAAQRARYSIAWVRRPMQLAEVSLTCSGTWSHTAPALTGTGISSPVGVGLSCIESASINTSGPRSHLPTLF